jgi:adenylate kinase
MLAAHCGYPSISTGDVLRDAVKKQTDLGKKAQMLMEAGELVPDSLVDEIVKTRITDKDTESGFILDGYPRTLGQAGFFESVAAQMGIPVLALGIMVDDEILVARLSSRWNCTRCGKIFNTELNPPREPGKCDECGAALAQRRDDRPEVVRERLQVYHRATRPLIDFYKEREQYVEVSGEGSVEEIFDSIVRVLDR